MFVVEQGCVYPDMDDHNLVAWHLTGTDASGRLLGVARLLLPGEKYAEPSLARVIVTKAARGTGHPLVDEALRVPAKPRSPGRGTAPPGSPGGAASRCACGRYFATV